jgi:hypothetical protein
MRSQGSGKFSTVMFLLFAQALNTPASRLVSGCAEDNGAIGSGRVAHTKTERSGTGSLAMIRASLFFCLFVLCQSSATSRNRHLDVVRSLKLPFIVHSKKDSSEKNVVAMVSRKPMSRRDS